MGNWHPSQKKNDVDLSPQVLSQTSLDDKVWLEVTEENLFNESFTNEKYYLLHSRNADPDPFGAHPATTRQREKILSYSGREELAKKRAEDMMGIVDDNFPIEQHATDTLNRLVSALQTASVGRKTLYYDSVLQKRISILKRIHLALSREKARERLFVSSPDHGKQSTKNAVPTVIRMTVRLFITMLREQRDVKNSELTLRTLNAMLKELPLLSLQGEPQDCLDSFHQWLLSVVTDSSGLYTPTIKNETMEALIILALTTGSLMSILSAVDVLISNFANKQTELYTSLYLVPYLRQLANWQVDLALSSLSKDGLSGSWTILWNEDESKTLLPPLSSMNATMATNGSYIYIHDTFGLVKVGTGFLSESPDYKTTQGRIYSRNALWKAEEKGWLACVQDKLYYRSPSVEPASLIVFDASTLKEIGSIFQDGRGSISTEDNTQFPFGPEKLPDNRNNRSPLFSDGRFLYIITQSHSQYGSIKYYVDQYDPLIGMRHLNRVKLRYSESRKNSTSIVLNPKALEKSSFYTNGNYLVVVIPPPLATDYGYDSKTYLCRTFSLVDGSFVGNYSLDNHPLGPATCYDSVNNVIWNYLNGGGEIARYANEGLAPKFESPTTQQKAIHLPLPEDDQQPMSAKEVVVSLLTILGRLAVESMPSPTEKKLVEKLSLKEPFCIEVTTKTLTLILSIIGYCKENIQPTEDVENYRWIDMSQHLLQILKVNLYRLVSWRNRYPSHKATQLDKSQPVLQAMKDMLLGFIYRDLSKQEETKSSLSIETIQREACEVFTVGVDLFFQSSIEQAQFTLSLLNSTDLYAGKRILLEALMILFANHPNASYLVLPSDKNKTKFDPMSIFLPMVSKLLQVAEGSMHAPIDNHPDYTPTFTSSFPPMRLLMAIQKDLLLRAAQTALDTDLVTQALVAYTKKILSNASTLLEVALAKPSIEDALLRVRFSVIGALLPTLTNSLFLFSQNVWFAKELLPCLVELIQIVDKTNLRLTPVTLANLYYMQKRNEFIEGPSRVTETVHPYLATESKQTVTIPGVAFLSLVFDERSSTSGPSDFLQLYQDLELQQPVGERYFGDRSRWPKHRILVPGDTVVFFFHSENVEPSSWGYRCTVIGHMPESEKETIPWSIHLEKTLCSLGGQFTALLITGPDISEEEQVKSVLLDGDLLFGGIDENLVPSLLKPVINEEKLLNISWEDVGKKPKDFEDAKPNDEVEAFYRDIVFRSKESEASALADWIEEQIVRSPVKNNMIKLAQNYVLAPLLKHTNLTPEIMSLVGTQDAKGKHKVINPRVIQIWSLINRVKDCIIQRYQERQLNSALEEEYDFATRRRSVELSTSLAQHRESAYQQIAEQVIEKADFLMCISPWRPSESLAQAVINFVLDPMPLEVIKKLIRARRARAFVRVLGFQIMQNLIRVATYPTMKHEALSFLGPALKNSGNVKRDWPHHYLDHLGASGKSLLKAVTVSFTSLMSDVAYILRDESTDLTLRLIALDTWILDFKASDHILLHSVDIFHTVHRLMMSDFKSAHSMSRKTIRKYENALNIRLRKTAKKVFRLLGIICMSIEKDSHTDTSKADALQESFFSLMADQLEAAAAHLHTPEVQAPPEEKNDNNSVAPKVRSDSVRRITQSFQRNAAASLAKRHSEPTKGDEEKEEKRRDSGRARHNSVRDELFSKFKSAKRMDISLFKSSSAKVVNPSPSEPAPVRKLSDGRRNSWAEGLPEKPLPRSESSTSIPKLDRRRRNTLSDASDPPGRDPPKQTLLRMEEFDWFDTLSFLFTLSAYSVVQNALSGTRFLQIFFQLLQAGPPRIQLITLRLLRRILPNQNPDDLEPQKGKAFIATMLETIGSIHCLYPQIEQLDHKYLVIKYFIAELTSPSTVQMPPKMTISHPFFPFNDPELTLPSGWDKKSCKSQISLSEDNCTVTFNTVSNDDEPIGIIRSDVVIPDALEVFYYEVLIESDGDDGYVAVGIYPVDQKLKGLPGWFNGSYGFHGNDGSKYSYRLEGRGESYGTKFGKNDVVGCGWNVKEGTIFFTKNGKYLGTAFKNVSGKFYATVGVTTRNAKVVVNFGQKPLLFDLKQLPEITFADYNSRNGKVGHIAISFASEVVMLMRHLLKFTNWKQPMLKVINNTLNRLPLIVKNFSTLEKGNLYPFSADYSHLCTLIGCLAVLGGHTESIRTGGRVDVEVEGMAEKHIGIVLDYSPTSHSAIVMLNSEDNKVVVQPVASLTPVAEIPVDTNLFGLVRNYYNYLSLFFPPDTTHYPVHSFLIYYQIRCQVLKLISVWFQNPAIVSYFLDRGYTAALVSVALDPIEEEQPKVQKTEKKALMVTEQLFEFRALNILREYDVTQLGEGKLFKLTEKPEATSKNKVEKLEKFFGEKKLSRHDLLEKASDNSEGHSNDDNDAEIPNEIEDPTLVGTKIKWKDLNVGMYVIITRRESPTEGSSDWVPEMENTIGQTGLVRALDRKSKQALVNFYDSDTATSKDWWFSYKVLSVPKTVRRDPFQQIDDRTPEELIELATRTYRYLATQYARESIITLLGTIPATSMSITSMGSPQNLVNFLRLTVADSSSPLVRDFISKPARNQFLKINALLKQEPSIAMLPAQTDAISQWKKSNPVELSPTKAGFLTKQGKLVRWKRQWIVLQGNYLSYFRNPQSSTPIAVTELQNVVSVDDVESPKIKTPNPECCFQIVTTTKTIVLKASSQQEKEEWMTCIEAARQVSSPQFLTNNNNKLPDSSLGWILTRECVKHLNETVDADMEVLVEESMHPYQSGVKLKKLLHVEGAEKLLIMFEADCELHRSDLLAFYKDVGMNDLIVGLTGKGQNVFSPVVIESNHCWMSFKTDSSPKFKWGYKLYVTPLSMKLTDSILLTKPNFDFAYCMIDWMLTLVPMWVKELYCAEVYNALVAHLMVFKPHNLNRRVKVISCLTRLLSQWQVFPRESPDLSKIRSLKKEMFDLFDKDRNMGEGIHSVYLQRLIELVIQVEIIKETQKIPIDKDEKALDMASKSEFQWRLTPPQQALAQAIEEKEARLSQKLSLMRKSSQTSLEQEPEKKPKKEKRSSLKESKKKDSKPFVRDKAWFYEAVKMANTVHQLATGANFPEMFIKDAFRSSLKRIVAEESPHPYPQGVRVTSTVVLPGAQSLTVSFDPRCRTQPNADYLMFSRLTVGGDELGLFSGDFPKEDIIIPGDRFIWSFLSDAASQEFWGFKFTVTGNYTEEVLLELEAQCESELQKLVTFSEEWSMAMDTELVQFINSFCEKSHTSPLDFTVDKIDYIDLSGYQMLTDISKEALDKRVTLLKFFNVQMSAFLPLVDLRNLTDESSLASKICSLRGLLFYDVKLHLLNEALNNTKTTFRRPVVALNRQQEKLREECLFLQAFHELHHTDPARLRQNDRAFEVKLEKEGAEDAGGPYREAITHFCQDIQSKELGLFIPCPNALEEVGFNQDKFIPNPAANSPSHLAQFEFIGKLIGIAIRTKNSLDLSFPAIVWKSLVCSRLDRADIEAIDKRCIQFIDSIRNIHQEGVTEETFSSYIFETFTFRSADGRLVELKPGGKNIPVTWQNKNEFIALAEHYRLNEFNSQTEALCRGVASIIPLHELYVFTWQELEFRVCAHAGVDLELLAARTEYYGVSPSDRHVMDFWEVLRSFTPTEQALFLRFVSGRSRLPPASEFTTKFKLQAFTKSKENEEDNYLPEAQTCFFSLALPPYSSKEIMREKLLYAINTCKEIDTDFVVRDVAHHETNNDSSGSEAEEDPGECATQ